MDYNTEQPNINFQQPDFNPYRKKPNRMANLSLVLGVLGIVLAMLWIHSQNHRWESGKYRPLATKIVEEDEPEMCGA